MSRRSVSYCLLARIGGIAVILLLGIAALTVYPNSVATSPMLQEKARRSKNARVTGRKSPKPPKQEPADVPFYCTRDGTPPTKQEDDGSAVLSCPNEDCKTLFDENNGEVKAKCSLAFVRVTALKEGNIPLCICPYKPDKSCRLKDKDKLSGNALEPCEGTCRPLWEKKEKGGTAYEGKCTEVWLIEKEGKAKADCVCRYAKKA